MTAEYNFFTFFLISKKPPQKNFIRNRNLLSQDIKENIFLIEPNDNINNNNNSDIIPK